MEQILDSSEFTYEQLKHLVEQGYEVEARVSKYHHGANDDRPVWESFEKIKVKPATHLIFKKDNNIEIKFISTQKGDYYLESYPFSNSPLHSYGSSGDLWIKIKNPIIRYFKKVLDIKSENQSGFFEISELEYKELGKKTMYYRRGNNSICSAIKQQQHTSVYTFAAFTQEAAENILKAQKPIPDSLC